MTGKTKLQQELEETFAKYSLGNVWQPTQEELDEIHESLANDAAERKAETQRYIEYNRIFG